MDPVYQVFIVECSMFVGYCVCRALINDRKQYRMNKKIAQRSGQLEEMTHLFPCKKWEVENRTTKTHNAFDSNRFDQSSIFSTDTGKKQHY